MECAKMSPIIHEGETFSTKWGTVKLVRVDGNGVGLIDVKPNGWSSVPVYTVDHRIETVGPMTVECSFFIIAGVGAHFWVCGPEPEPTPEPTPWPGYLTIYDIDANVYPNDYTADGKVRVEVSFSIKGAGSGRVKVSSGSKSVTVQVSAGTYSIDLWLEAGSRSVCVNWY